MLTEDETMCEGGLGFQIRSCNEWAALSKGVGMRPAAQDHDGFAGVCSEPSGLRACLCHATHADDVQPEDRDMHPFKDKQGMHAAYRVGAEP